LSTLRIFTVLLLIGLALPAPAHHSRSNFDLKHLVEMSGEVTQFRWANPHIYLKIKREDGQLWNIEGHSIAGVTVIGWSRNTVKVGDRIKIGVFPDRRVGKQFALLEWVITREGVARQSFPDSSLPANVTDAITLIKHDRGAAMAAVTPSTDFSGNWANDLSKLDLRVAGFGVPEDLTLTAKGETLKSVFNLNEDPTYNCTPLGIPRTLWGPYGFRFDRYSDRLVMQREHENTRWTIWLDETKAPVGQIPDPFGLSIGKIEGNTLRFTTTNISAQKWGIARGIDSSDKMRVEAKFELHPNGKQIQVEFSTTDPVYLSEPYTQTRVMLKHLDRVFSEEACDPEVGRFHLELE